MKKTLFSFLAFSTLISLVALGRERAERFPKMTVANLNGIYTGKIILYPDNILDPRFYPPYLTEEGIRDVRILARGEKGTKTLTLLGEVPEKWRINVEGENYDYLDGKDPYSGRHVWLELIEEIYDLGEEREILRGKHPGIEKIIKLLRERADRVISEFKKITDFRHEGMKGKEGVYVTFAVREDGTQKITYESIGSFQWKGERIPMHLFGEEGKEEILHIGGYGKERLIYSIHVERIRCGIPEGLPSCRDTTRVEWPVTGLFILEDPDSWRSDR